MHSPYHCGNPVTHARWRRNHNGSMGTFTAFLTAFDFNTSASLTTTVSQIFTVSWACRSLEGNREITFQSHSHTATTTSASPTSQPTHWAACVNKQIRIFSQRFVLYFPPYFTHFILGK
ncbi:hypothetical protein I79_004736 [Cricetulus griseus]|uniref:Uncharacterized protein n=1 Tax=Cricetulus griseus TaxID=10029 RepID=G3H3C1_CRIGR|nr:hypothetical protein I79_004736 [Cricetulus griseus]